MKSIAPIPCIVCRRSVEHVDRDRGDVMHNQPYKATSFVSHGQYGSTVWDPMNSELTLEVNVCDECLVKAAEKGHVIHTRRTTTTTWQHTYWTI